MDVTTQRGSVAVEVDFDYVVERKRPDPVCFGSRLSRNTAPIGDDLSPFQKMKTGEFNPKTGPGSYCVEKNRGAMAKLDAIVKSTKGWGPLASVEPRFKEKLYDRNPSPTRYNVEEEIRSKKRAAAPFGSNVKRMVLKDNKLPGPGTYDIASKKCRRTRFMYNLGHPKMVPAIETFCVSKPIDTCVKCEQTCEGDYWHKDYTTFLCHLCWEDEHRGNELYGEKELKTFKKIRNCSFAHRHEGTTAAIRKLPPRKINKKIRLENYLDLYLKC